MLALVQMSRESWFVLTLHRCDSLHNGQVSGESGPVSWEFCWTKNCGPGPVMHLIAGFVLCVPSSFGNINMGQIWPRFT